MVGAIVKRDILAHPLVTIRCFGWLVFFKALLASRKTTFLSLLTDSQALRPAGEGVPEFVARCVKLELKAQRLYELLARRFATATPAGEFFASLARQEGVHAELLELAETAAGHERWDETKVRAWRDVVPHLEQRMEQVLAQADETHELRSALETVISVESSEINDVFRSVIAASDSRFVERMRVFQRAGRDHLEFICDAIEQLDSELASNTRLLRQRLTCY